ncbi:MAG TPA: flavin reductase [Candidatus Thioglobus sp.]|jgi:flavin reductase (DIM6/NTAB) family NADH-FMN oxidoreductase RutF|nr:flavin reductase [Candidatus Thioglobus sp.]HIL21343.1 flavin reductase [Candidatus Thioglobus sp.]
MISEETRKFRHALGAFPTGVTIVTTIDANGEPIGFTANSFSSVSLDPKLILICIDKASINLTTFTESGHFAVSILSEKQQQISTTFASPVEDRFSNVNWQTKTTGSPIISGAVAWFDCAKDKCVDAGDHYILLGRVLEFNSNIATPLVFLRGNYVNLTLEQKMLRAMEDNSTKVLVGALIECRSKIFLNEKADGYLDFPTASSLGSLDNNSSLLGKLNLMGIDASEHYLFSVFESDDDKTSLIYYRAQVENTGNAKEGGFYAFDEVPFERIRDEWSRTMLKRYIAERALSAFGIYVGNETDGAVEAVTKPNDY